MTRYEAAVSTHVTFGEPGGPAFSRADQLVIQFDGRAFVWHDLRQPESDGVDPVVTTMVDDATDSGSEMLATNRFISTLSFVTDQPMAIGVTAAAGFKGELDRPLLGQPALAATVIVHAPTAIDVSADERLRLVLGLFREGRAANSPFYGFLALYNALDAAFDNNERQRNAFIDHEVVESAPTADFLQDELRNAVAHAVRRPGKAVLDPDDFRDRSRLGRSSEVVAALVRKRVGGRWPGGVTVTW